MSSNRSSAVVVGCLLLGLLAAAGIIVVASVMLLRGGAESATTPTPEPSAVGTHGPTSSGVARAPATAAASSSRPAKPGAKGELAGLTTAKPASGELSVPLPVADVTRVDPQQLFAPATQLAQRLEPHAELRLAEMVFFSGAVREGTMDLSGSSSVRFQFAYHYLDRTKPPGEDSVEGAIEVKARAGRLVAKPDDFHVRIPGDDEVLPYPSCPVVQAWRTAVGSGVPANAVARLSYRKAFRTRGRFAWVFTIKGHDEYRREVDALTCELVSSHASKPVGPPAATPPGKSTPKSMPPPAVPPPPKPKPRPGCGCAPADLMCQMKCGPPT